MTIKQALNSEPCNIRGNACGTYDVFSRRKFSHLINTIYADFEAEIKELKKQRMDLWMLLDNIDTAEDIAKDSDKLFRSLCRNEHQKRWEIYAPKDDE